MVKKGIMSEPAQIVDNRTLPRVRGYRAGNGTRSALGIMAISNHSQGKTTIVTAPKTLFTHDVGDDSTHCCLCALHSALDFPFPVCQVIGYT